MKIKSLVVSFFLAVSSCVYAATIDLTQSSQWALTKNGADLWIATQSGLIQYNTQRNAAYLFNTSNGLKEDNVISLACHNGNIWIGGSTNGVSVYDGQIFTHYDESNSCFKGQNMCFAFDKEGRVYVGGMLYLRILDNAKCSTILLDKTSETDKNPIFSGLQFDDDGALWFTGHIFGKYQPDGTTTIYNFHDTSEGLAIDKTGNKWMTSIHQGLVRYDAQTMEMINYDEDNSIIPSVLHISKDILVDSDNNIWIGSKDCLLKFDGKTFISFPLPSTSQNVDLYISSLLLDGSTIWIGTTACGLYKFENGTFTAITSVPLITDTKVAAQDTYVYPEEQVITDKGTVTYTLTNKWLYSVNLDNWESARPNPLAGRTNAMIHQDGILYFPYCESDRPTNPPYIVRVDAQTGKMLEPLQVADNIFKKDDEYLVSPFCDMKKDDAGNVVVCNYLISGSGDFQIWSIDLSTGEGNLLVDLSTPETHIYSVYPFSHPIRFSRIGVSGDITKDALIIALSENAADVFSWHIVNGKWDGQTNWKAADIAHKIDLTPCIHMISATHAYVDVSAAYPMLLESKDDVWRIKDDLTNSSAVHLTVGLGNTARSTSPNGVLEFEVDGEYYLLIAGDGTQGVAPSTFVLYKFEDEQRQFKAMTPLYEFPYAGMGTVSNPQNTVVMDVEVAKDGTSVDLFVYTSENGYGVYTLKIDSPTNVENILIDNEGGIIYDIFGRVTTTPQVGQLYICNGKKFIMK